MKYRIAAVSDLIQALERGPSLIQIMTGPRQVGKTTAAMDVQQALSWPSVFEAADYFPAPGPK